MSDQPRKWTEEEKEKCVRLRSEGLLMSEIAEHLDRSPSSVSNFLWAYHNNQQKEPTPTTSSGNGDVPKAQTKNPTITVENDNAVLESCTEDIRTLDQLIQVCDIDMTLWDVERWTANTWQVGVKIEDRVVAKNLFQVKAFLKKKAVTIEDVKSMFALCSAPFVSREPIRKKNKGRKLLEISVPDIHLGKLCWGQETGGADYDTKEAIDRFKNAVESLISREDPSDIQDILLPIGNDFYNSDGKENETSNGTPQDTDSRWQKNFKKGCELATWAINRCLKVAPVRVPIVAGNHDTEKSYYLGCFLEAKFGENKNVEINNAPTERKYCRFGNTIIGFTHGDRMKLKDLVSLVQNEQRRAWGESKFCEWHLGHLHRESTIEESGVIARVIPSLCPPDAWHARKGFVTNVPAAQAFVYDAELGIERIHYFRLG
jgi:transposase-like protein